MKNVKLYGVKARTRRLTCTNRIILEILTDNGEWRTFLAIIRITAAFALAITSAVLLADMRPNQQTAERILNARVGELVKAPDKLIESKTEELYIGEKLVKFPAGEKAPSDVYRLEYFLEPVKATDADRKVRQLNIAVHWQPNPEYKQSQTLRQRTPILINKAE
jgi:hypothetical protein